MIDTDKYEGHAEGPWKIESYNRGQAFTGINFNMTHTEKEHLAMKNGREKEREATANLIADAPLLLAEVKRLKGLIHGYDKEAKILREAYRLYYPVLKERIE
tara:strand:- start:193 stop:498 length:306 start_codon:yes stop_codon:yes gene_type:complete